jgi:hypothetical protein
MSSTRAYKHFAPTERAPHPWSEPRCTGSPNLTVWISLRVLIGGLRLGFPNTFRTDFALGVGMMPRLLAD